MLGAPQRRRHLRQGGGHHRGGAAGGSRCGGRGGLLRGTRYGFMRSLLSTSATSVATAASAASLTVPRFEALLRHLGQVGHGACE
jgi:hypothetical protein